MDSRTHTARLGSSIPGAFEEPSPGPRQRRRSDFAQAVLSGLEESPRAIAPKYFYDTAGSALFDRICELPEYYPTRTESIILAERAQEIAAYIGPRAEVIEFGAGSMTKVRVLFDAFAAADQPLRYLPIDVSGEHLALAARQLRNAYPHIVVQPVVADYTMQMLLPARLPGSGRRIGFFPGSTIGNLQPGEALAFLQLAGHLLRGGGLLIGVDLVKHPATLHAAYNDSQGVTAAFNLNLLRRINEELGGDIALEGFAHHAFYEPRMRRVEMHLVSLRPQAVHLAGREFHFEQGDSIHTENSHKFSIDGFRRMAIAAGFRPGPAWVDEHELFSVHWLHAPVAR
jgi:dimethylhistidine N-methyltransferase